MKLRSAPILVSESAGPFGNAAVAKKRDTVKPIDATTPTTAAGARRRRNCRDRRSPKGPLLLFLRAAAASCRRRTRELWNERESWFVW
jgi:hypothetical protein